MVKRLLISLTLALYALTAQAEKPITFVVAYPSGGDTDVLARMFAAKLSDKLQRPVIVENKAGASGIIGTMYAKSAPADGTVVLVAPSTFVTSPLIDPKTARYNAVTDFKPVMQITRHSMVAVVNSSVSSRTALDLASDTKRGVVVHYATPGVGSPMHILGEMYNKATQSKTVHVPYKGNAQVTSALLSGEVSFAWITLLPVLPHIQSGKLRVVAIAGAERSPFLPDVPTFTEQGIKGVEIESWLGFLVPKGTPNDVVRELNLNLNDILTTQEFQAKFKSLALTPVGGSPEVFSQTIKRDTEKFTKVLKQIKVKND